MTDDQLVVRGISLLFIALSLFVGIMLAIGLPKDYREATPENRKALLRALPLIVAAALVLLAFTAFVSEAAWLEREIIPLPTMSKVYFCAAVAVAGLVHRRPSGINGCRRALAAAWQNSSRSGSPRSSARNWKQSCLARPKERGSYGVRA